MAWNGQSSRDDVERAVHPVLREVRDQQERRHLQRRAAAIRPLALTASDSRPAEEDERGL